jgi:CheY-like chemotaxis protein
VLLSSCPFWTCFYTHALFIPLCPSYCTIVNFCPDEQELVLEVFKQLGSGNAIRDVPVRFRTKDGRIVNLLVDSNVKYDTVKTETGETTKKFGHTRCFIRDDTSRQIREARAKTLLLETKRSLKMLDNFSSRSIHHMRTPLQIMQNTCELVTEQLVLLQQHPDDAGGGGNNNKKIETDECIALLQNAEAQITKAVHLSDDLVQLGRLDQGAELVLSKTVIDLVTWGQEVLYASFATCDAPATTKGRPLSLEITPAIFEDDDRDCDGGPAKIYSDRFVLNRVLTALLKHARRVHDYKQRDMVTLRIGYQSGGLCTVEVIFKVDTKTSDDDGYSSSCSTASSNHKFSTGKFPPIFQRYHQEYIPEETMEVDFETATSLRQGIERHVNSFQDNNLGISLSLAYFLVQGLNSELRYALQPNGMTKFFFVLPKHDLPEGVECSKLLPKMIVVPSKESNMTTQEKSLDEVPALNDSLQNLSDKATTFPTFARSSPTKGTTGPSLMAPLDYVSMKPLTQEPSAPRKRRASVFNVAQHEMMSPIKLKREVPIEVDVPKFQIACQGFTPMDPPHVLIVEDTEMAAKMLRVTLSKFNCTSDTVVNGRLAVDKLRNAAPGEYDLVLMDLRMPEMDGLTATKILKQEMKLSVPIIALTAETRASIRAECEEIGFDDFYSKPLTRDGLKDVLLKHTGYKVI